MSLINERNIEKGHDLLEEAFTLGQGSSQEASGMQDLSQSLKTHLRGFSERLEDTRERLEDTSRCYQLLDKAYEWALEAMKFVSRMKMEQNMAGSQLTQLMKALQTYLQNHPPISNDVFQEMINLANKLENDKLLDQCKVAQTRCQETTDLIRTRQTTLLKARQQYGDMHAYSQLDLTDIAESPVPPFNTSSPSWSHTPTTSTPQPFTRRRSVGSLPSAGYPTPACYVSQGYSSFFRETYHLDTYISEHEEQFVDEMISDYSCLPPAFVDEKQSSLPSEGSTASSTKSEESLPVSSAVDTQTALPTTTNSPHLPIDHSKPHKKYMRRSQTWQFESEPWQKGLPEDSCNLERNYTKGSTDSIQTLVETEEASSLELTSNNTNTPVLYPLSSVNSHLHHEEAGDEDNDLSQEQIKHKRTLALIMREMIQTERDYVNSLEYTIENYIPELLREDIPQALRGKRNVVFGNIEKIFEFHSQYFLHELEKCDKTPFLVGQCFLRFERQFYLYALYNKNKPKSDELMLEYGTSFFKNKQLQLTDKMDLASYLLKPVQRMGKYALLIKQLVKECPEKDPEYADLKSAEDMVKFQLRHGNDLLAMDCIRECDVDVKEQGRLLRQDEFLVWQGKGRKCLRRHLFLFEELIVFTKARRDPDKKSRDIYQYKNSIKMSDIGLTEQVGESTAKFEIWFRRCKLNDTYILQAGSITVRNSWVQEISKLLWKQALRNRELRLAEMSSMGIGNKPCLDIKPSQDQINDRSISINQLTKAPRFRNSISIIPTDPTRNTNKRPHSIISVSSSSSGSSQASSSQYGALNLGFDPSDSPKNHHRSITQQSQCSAESGIIPDISIGYDYLSEMDSSKKLERTSSNASTDSMSTNNSLPVSPIIDTQSPISTSEIATENR
uniref:DH domain-containing protein n=1 Tax=Strigamia maritima TaxID=126957 RepID=T1J0M6_STRMM